MSKINHKTMTNKQLQALLRQYPDGIEVRLHKGSKKKKSKSGSIVIEHIIDDFDSENVLHVEGEDEHILINPPIY